MTPKQITLDIYKTISVSLRNDAYADYQQAQFVGQVAPIVAEAIRAVVAQEREACARDAEAWVQIHALRGYQADEVADSIAAAIRARGKTERAA